MFNKVILHHKIPLVITLLSWAIVGYYLGPEAFFLVIALSILEITLSADNAVVNSRVLVKMSPMWQKLFMTVGIFVAVFLIRFALPIVLVAVASQMPIGQVTDLALNDADEYGKRLHEIAPLINSFGGVFLFMVGTFFFLDKTRKHFWIPAIEQGLSRLATVPYIKTLVISSLFILIQLLLPSDMRQVVGVSMFVAIIIYTFLHSVTILMERFEQKNELKKQVGWVAFASFMYLEVLDASFSLDGVIGAFALTNNIIIIMVGLGVGALWVRTLTLHMVKSKTLAHYKYLESGAHWAIVFLSAIMILELFHIELAEWFVASVGLICIAASVIGSRKQEHVKKI